MLKNNSTMKYLVGRSGWYFLTLLVAITINFFLPRLGDADPVNIIISKTSGGLSHEEVMNKEDALLKRYGLAILDDNGHVRRHHFFDFICENGDTVVIDAGEILSVSGQSKASVDIIKGDNIKTAKGLSAVVAIVENQPPVRKSLFVQYVAYMVMTLKGDLGVSMIKDEPVWDIVLKSIPWTLGLQLPSIVFGWILGNLLGAFAAYKRGIFDKLFFPISLLSCSIPFFVFGMVLVYIFGVVLNWFPAYGGYAWAQTPGFTGAFIASAAYHYILPFFSIFPVFAGGQAIGMRSMGIYELGTDYIKYSKTLGIKENRIIMYVFRNAMLPQLTGLAFSLGTAIGGALIAEMIFSYPGLGMALLTAVQENDYFVIQGGALLVSITLLIANFVVDMLIGIYDPRVRAGRTGE